jgi:hypothetical protein
VAAPTTAVSADADVPWVPISFAAIAALLLLAALAFAVIRIRSVRRKEAHAH